MLKNVNSLTLEQAIREVKENINLIEDDSARTEGIIDGHHFHIRYWKNENISDYVVLTESLNPKSLQLTLFQAYEHLITPEIIANFIKQCVNLKKRTQLFQLCYSNAKDTLHSLSPSNKSYLKLPYFDEFYAFIQKEELNKIYFYYRGNFKISINPNHYTASFQLTWFTYVETYAKIGSQERKT